MNNKTTRNSILLLVTAAVWGAAFVAQTVGGQTIGAYSFNCVRCIIGALVLIPVMKFLDKKDLSPRKPQTLHLLKSGIQLKCINGVWRICQRGCFKISNEWKGYQIYDFHGNGNPDFNRISIHAALL